MGQEQRMLKEQLEEARKELKEATDNVSTSLPANLTKVNNKNTQHRCQFFK